MLASGCASRFVQVRAVQDATSYRELQDLLAGLECHDLDAATECLFYLSSLNLLQLQRRVQDFRFKIDSNDKITEKQLNDFSVRYHFFPPTELPESASQFK